MIKKLLSLLVLMLVTSSAVAVDVQISTLTDTPDPAPRGGEITYAISLLNAHNDTATNVTLAVPIPATTSFVRVDDARCNHDSGTNTVNCTFGDFVGSVVTNINLVLKTSGSTGNTIALTTTVGTDSADTDTSNNDETQNTTIGNGADLNIVQTSNPAAVFAGKAYNYTLNVNNIGPDDSNTITVVDTLPTGISYVSSSGSGWTCSNSGQTVTCNRANITNGDSAPAITLNVKVTGAITGTVTNVAEVSTTSATVSDPYLSNNSSTANTTIAKGTDLSITKTVAMPVVGGKTTMFTLKPRNLGPFNADNVVVTDALPAGFTYQSYTGASWACGEAGGTVTCTRASYNVGETDDIVITTDVPSTGTGIVNNAYIDSDTDDPITSNNHDDVTFDIVPDGADLSITKVKTPNPVALGGDMNSRIRVHNHGPNTTTGTVTVVDTLSANETYSSFSGTNWACTHPGGIGGDVTCEYSSQLINGADSAYLNIVTIATNAGSLTNRACTEDKGVLGQFDPVSSNNCTTGTAKSTTAIADLDISKTVSTPNANAVLEVDESTITYVLTVTNTGDDIVDTGGDNGVVIQDTIPGFVNTATTAITASVTGGTQQNFSCDITNATVQCVLDDNQTFGGTAGSGADTVEITITTSRGLFDGDKVNTASVYSQILGEQNTANNSDSVDITIDPIADVEMTTLSISPNSTEAGTESTYVLTFKNNGPSSAANVVVTHEFTPPAGRTYKLISSDPSKGSCLALAGDTLTCNIGTLTRNETETITLKVRPGWDGANTGWILANESSITTDTHESIPVANNSQTAALTVIKAKLDLLVNNTDVTDPVGWTIAPGVFPASLNNIIIYEIEMTNQGPSLATGVKLTDVMTPKAGKQVTFLCDSAGSTGCNAATSICNNINASATGNTIITTVCSLPDDIAANTTVTRFLYFSADTAPDATGDTHSTMATISANEDDTVPGNDNESETTSVRATVDLAITKTPSQASVSINEHFNWNIVVKNNGPGDSADSDLTDNLPADMELIGPPVPSQGTCTGAAGDDSFTCELETITNGASVTVTVPVVVTAKPSSASISNTASVTTFGVDSDDSNDSDTGTVTVTESSIAGTVYNDQNDNGSIDNYDHGIANVTMTLTGKDDWGNELNEVVVTNVDGDYLFDHLPTSDANGYTITETHPTNFTDGLENLSGVIDNSSRMTDVITAIALPTNTDIIKYDFGELGKASLRGSVWYDANNNGIKDVNETTGIVNTLITLSGTETVSGKVVNFTHTTDVNGEYQFTNLTAGTYVITETQPTIWGDGSEQLGDAGGNITNDTFSAITLTANLSGVNYNFGEQGASISGYVYRDANDNGLRDTAEVAINNVKITLTGFDDHGFTVNQNTTTDVNGYYQILGLPASNAAGYTLTETQPSLIFDGKDTLGSLGGTLANDVISAIILPVNGVGLNYNFGEGGDIASSISGSVFIDLNDDGIKDADEVFIENVTITLTGTNSLGVTINKTQTTNVVGQYSFNNLAPSDANGYSITETQPTNFEDGLDSKLGQILTNSRTSDVISKVILGVDEHLLENNFAELYPSKISGTVFIDVNDDGMQTSDELGIEGVSITLTGTDNLNRVISKTLLTDDSGNYTFTNLPENSVTGYTITENHPSKFDDGLDSKHEQVLVDSRTSDIINMLILKSNEHLTKNNFGELYSGKISGTVFIDGNNDGLQSTDDLGIENVSLTLTGTDYLNRAVSETQITNASGEYTFIHLPASDANGYTITETQPSNFVDGLDSKLGQVLVNSRNTDVINRLILADQDHLTDNDFAELQLGKISGNVYIDANDDGVKDNAEVGIEGVTVTLAGVDFTGTSVTTVLTTDEQGDYSFDNLLPSDENGYQITENQPDELLDGLESIGKVVIPGSRFNDSITSILLAANQELDNYNFGELDTSSLSGTVWVDENDNGIIDDEEAIRIANVTITLSGIESHVAAGETPQKLTATTVTDENGDYSFTMLSAGKYSISQKQPNAWMDGKDHLGTLSGELGNDLIEAIELNAGQNGTDYNFGERGSDLQGVVYNDLNNNGLIESNEAGIPEVEMTLTGTDSNGQPVRRITYTLVDGQYLFKHLPLPNTEGYQVYETQPEEVDDGKDSLGSHNGTLGNDHVSDIIFTSHFTHVTDYNFGELIRDPARISGMVWLDSNHNRSEDDGNGLEGWTVQLIDSRDNGKDNANVTPIATVITGKDGTYLFDGLSPGEYEVRFIHPQGGVIYGYPVSDEPGVDLTAGTIRKLILEAGEHIDEQNLPIDPSGVVYDSKTRETVAGATVTLITPPGFDPDRDLIGGQDNMSQITSDDGLYQFLFFNSAPSGEYRLVVTEPMGYLPGVSTQIPACVNTPTIMSNTTPALVQRDDKPPKIGAVIHDVNSCGTSSTNFTQGENSTQYYLSFMINPQLPSANVVNNHIPVDPINNELLSVVKSTPTTNASRGDLVPYTIMVSNNLERQLNNTAVVDQLPPGFKYVQGSAKIDGMTLDPEVNNRQLIWNNIDFDALAQHSFTLMTVIGAGVGEGEYINQAWAQVGDSSNIITNIASASVRIVPDPIFDCSDIIGKVFNDKNINGYQDQGEKGLPAIRIATAQGLLVTTDEDGRYHIACAEVPNAMRGSNFILKVDERTLPSGFRISTENPRIVRLTRGKLVKANFGATIHRVVRIQLNEMAFNGNTLRAEHQEALSQTIQTLQLKPSILRIAYQQGDENDDTVAERFERLTEQIQQQWQEFDGKYELIIEQEITPAGDDLELLGQTGSAHHE
ncbi:SdrD B-like domain-containing protein [Thalassotalea piscium]